MRVQVFSRLAFHLRLLYPKCFGYEFQLVARRISSSARHFTDSPLIREASLSSQEILLKDITELSDKGDKEKLRIACSNVLDNIAIFQPQQLIRIVDLAANTSNLPFKRELTEKSLRRFKANSSTLKMSDVVWMMTAAAKVHTKDREVINFAEAEVMRQDLTNFTSLQLASILEACAILKCTTPEIYSSLLSEVLKRHNLSRHILRLLIWSSAVAPQAFTDEQTIELIDKIMKGPLNQISISTIAWTLGKRQMCHKGFYDKIFSILLYEDITRWAPRVISMVAWSMSCNQMYSPEVMDQLAIKVLPLLENFPEQSLSNLAYAFGTLNHRAEDLLLKVVDIHTKQLQEDTASQNTVRQATFNITWACLVFGIFPMELLTLILRPSVAQNALRSNSKVIANFLLQCDTALRYERPNSNIEPLQLDVFLDLQKLLIQQLPVITDSSNYNKNMTAALIELAGSEKYFQTEALTYGPYIIDFELLLNQDGKLVLPPEGFWVEKPFIMNSATQGSDSFYQNVKFASDWYTVTVGDGLFKVALEADGPHHYVGNSLHVTGKTALKKRLLSAMGWKVLSIPWFEWKHLLFSTEDQANYLAALFKSFAHKHC